MGQILQVEAHQAHDVHYYLFIYFEKKPKGGQNSFTAFQYWLREIPKQIHHFVSPSSSVHQKMKSLTTNRDFIYFPVDI